MTIKNTSFKSYWLDRFNELKCLERESQLNYSTVSSYKQSQIDDYNHMMNCINLVSFKIAVADDLHVRILIGYDPFFNVKEIHHFVLRQEELLQKAKKLTMSLNELKDLIR